MNSYRHSLLAGLAVLLFTFLLLLVVPPVATQAAANQPQTADNRLVAQAPAPMTRDEILQRARAWTNAGVPYSQSKYRDGYRTDCSGFVSYAWKLSWSPDTTNLYRFARDISIDNLQPGDILNNKLSGNNGHTLMFAGWINQSEKRFWAYDMNYLPDGYAVYRQHKLVPNQNGWGIEAFPNTSRKGTFYAQRRLNIIESSLNSSSNAQMCTYTIGIQAGRGNHGNTIWASYRPAGGEWNGWHQKETYRYPGWTNVTLSSRPSGQIHYYKFAVFNNYTNRWDFRYATVDLTNGCPRNSVLYAQ